MSTRAFTLLAFASTLLAVGCGVVAPSAEIFTGSCEGSPYAKDFDTGGVDLETAIWAEADGDDVVLHLDNLDANCCPSAGADIAVDGFSVEVDFEDVTAEDACGCMCVMDFEVRIPELGPGDYSIDVDYNGADLETVEVTVP